MSNEHYRYASPETAPFEEILILAVRFDNHALHDVLAGATTETIGYRDGETKEFRFAGWCWNDDHFTQGEGMVVGWRRGLRQGAIEFKLEEE